MIAKDNDNDGYNDYRGLLLEITHVAYSTDEHPGYDTALQGEALVDLKIFETGIEVPFSLYEYEFSKPH